MMKVEITIPIKFITIRAEVEDKDLYAAIDKAVDKLEAQIRKNKHKLNRSLQEKAGLKEVFKRLSQYRGTGEGTDLANQEKADQTRCPNDGRSNNSDGIA